MIIALERADGGVSIAHVAQSIIDIEDAAERRAAIEDMVEKTREVTPEGITGWREIQVSDIPADRTFRSAWKADLTHDIEKCKTIAHDMRRKKRDEEFAPHDKIISLQIPGRSHDDAEAARAAIRAKYETVQTAIDTAATAEEIKEALK